MEVGVVLRNMGEASTPGILRGCARAAEQAGLESIWVTDHVAIPPDDAEGSDGRYVDPLVTLAWLAGATERIRLGTGVLILPYRPALPTAKQVASLQELSGGRLLLGVGIGWMDAEFRALGVDRHRRGRISDQTLDFLRRSFDRDLLEANGQPFLFRPRPPRPPIYVGGAAPHALERAVRLGDGWLPMRLPPERIAAARVEYDALSAAAGRAPGEIVVMGALDLGDPPAATARLRAYAEAGATRFVCGLRYRDVDDCRGTLDALAALVARARE